MKPWMLVFIALPLLFFAIRSPSHAEENLSPQELAALIQASGKKLQLIDVRTPEEHQEGHIAGSKLIPLAELKGRLGEIDRKKPVIFYCRSGNRSAQALKVVAKQGLLSPKHLAGGVLAWTAQGLPLAR